MASPSKKKESSPSKKSAKRETSDDGFSIYNRVIVFSGGHCALGPGRVAVMEEIGKHRNLGLAAKQMDMSYMKAWLLVRSLNQSFEKPVIELARGGKKGGGASLTASGQKVLALYRQMEKQADKAAKAAGQKLKKHLR